MFTYSKYLGYSCKVRNKIPYIDKSVRKKKEQYTQVKKHLDKNLYIFTTDNVSSSTDIIGFWEDIQFLSRHYKDIYYTATINTVHNQLITDIYDKAWEYVNKKDDISYLQKAKLLQEKFKEYKSCIPNDIIIKECYNFFRNSKYGIYLNIYVNVPILTKDIITNEVEKYLDNEKMYIEKLKSDKRIYQDYILNEIDTSTVPHVVELLDYYVINYGHPDSKFCYRYINDSLKYYYNTGYTKEEKDTNVRNMFTELKGIPAEEFDQKRNEYVEKYGYTK